MFDVYCIVNHRNHHRTHAFEEIVSWPNGNKVTASTTLVHYIMISVGFEGETEV